MSILRNNSLCRLWLRCKTTPPGKMKKKLGVKTVQCSSRRESQQRLSAERQNQKTWNSNSKTKHLRALLTLFRTMKRLFHSASALDYILRKKQERPTLRTEQKARPHMNVSYLWMVRGLLLQWNWQTRCLQVAETSLTISSALGNKLAQIKKSPRRTKKVKALQSMKKK